MKLYKIRDWDSLFETCETRKLAHLRWVPIPNKHDGKSFRRIASLKNNVEIFAAWTLIVQIASKCNPRGTLIDGETPIGADDMALMTGFPEKIFSEALNVLSNGKIDWLQPVEIGELPASPGGSPAIPGRPAEEGKRMEGIEGIEGKEKKGKVALRAPTSFTTMQKAAEEVLGYLNIKAGINILPEKSTLEDIVKRLQENYSASDLNLVIDAKCKQWGGSAEMRQNLIPSTLFGKKFPQWVATAKAVNAPKPSMTDAEIVAQNKLNLQNRRMATEAANE